MIKIKVPATSANIGCGFDSLGCALTLYATFTFKNSQQMNISGCPKEYQNENNLVLYSYKKVFEKLNQPMIPVSIHIDSQIPLSRGLGSSASCIIGGIWGANTLLNYPLSKEECLDIATEIEGHPDNVAPALYGNLCASFQSDKVYCTQFQASKEIKMLALIPDFEISTKKAREVLPKQIKYQDAVFNLSRVASLCKAFETNDTEMIHAALQDKLHEPYRKKLINEYDKIKEICKEETAFFISGSGPTLICIYQDSKEKLIQEISHLKNKWQCLDLRIEPKGVQEERYD